MAQNEENLLPDPSKKNDEDKKKKRKFRNIVRELLSILLWVYIPIKLFVFDIDIYIIEHLSPQLSWIVRYKLFILLGLLTILFIFTKNKNIWTWSLFIFTYPIIFFFWRIPSLIIKRKNWNLVFAAIDSSIAFIQSFKLSFIFTSLFLIFSLFIFISNDQFVLWISIAIIFLIHLWLYVQRMILVFKPSSVYQAYKKFFSFSGDFVRREPLEKTSQLMLTDEELELPIEQLDEKQIQKWISGVQMAAFFNRICLFVAKKVKSYQESKYNIISHVIGFIILFFATIFTFSFLNLGIHKIDPNTFSYSSTPNFFIFFYYSFNTFLFNPIPELIANAPISQIASMTESFFALFLIAIFISVVLTFKNQREANELNKVIKLLRREGEKSEEYLRDKYKMDNISEALEALSKLNSAMVDFLYTITESIDS